MISPALPLGLKQSNSSGMQGSRKSITTGVAANTSPLIHRNVYISGLPTGFTSTNFRQLCQQFGKVEASKLCVDAHSSPTKGYGFCLFLEESSAAACIKGLHGAVLGGRKLQARYADAGATPMPSTTTAIPNPAATTVSRPSHRANGGNGSCNNKKKHQQQQQQQQGRADQQNRDSGSDGTANAFMPFPTTTGGGFYLSASAFLANNSASSNLGLAVATSGSVSPSSICAIGQMPSGGYAADRESNNNIGMMNPQMAPLCLSPPPMVQPLPAFSFVAAASGGTTTMSPQEIFLASSLLSSNGNHHNNTNSAFQAMPTCSVSAAGTTGDTTSIHKTAYHHHCTPGLVSPLSSFSLLSPSVAGSSTSSTDPQRSSEDINVDNNSNLNNSNYLDEFRVGAAVAFTPLSANLELAPGYNGEGSHRSANNPLSSACIFPMALPPTTGGVVGDLCGGAPSQQPTSWMVYPSTNNNDNNMQTAHYFFPSTLAQSTDHIGNTFATTSAFPLSFQQQQQQHLFFPSTFVGTATPQQQ